MCLFCTFPQPILISNNKSPFCLLAMQTVDSSTRWFSVFIGAGTFNTKYLHYHLLFLLSSPPSSLFVTMDLNTLCTYGMESGCWKAWAPPSYGYQRTEREKENVKYDKYWHLHFKCHLFLKRGEERSSVEIFQHWKLGSLSHQDKVVSCILPRKDNKTVHDMWETLCLLLNLKLRK